RYVQAMRPALDVTTDDKYLHTASFAFSSSTRQLMVPLTAGATVVLASVEQVMDPIQLFSLVKVSDVTVMDIVPSYWRSCNQVLACLDKYQRELLLENRLRLILSASEPLMSNIPSTWRFEFKHDARILNMFGQTETSGIVSIFPVTEWSEEEIRIVPIGYPIA